MVIIKPILKDIPQLLKLWKEQYCYHYNRDKEYYVPYSEELGKRFRRYLVGAISRDEPNILMAKTGERLTGFVTFEVDSESYFDTKITDFGVAIELFVEEDNRRKGIGSKLMEAVEKYFSQKGLKYVKLQCSTYNQTALDFYKRIGYQNRQSLLYKKIDKKAS